MTDCVAVLPLWGESYIKKFFALHFHNYLSRGNLDGAALGKTTLLFVTTQDDVPLIWQQLENSPLRLPSSIQCQVSFISPQIKKMHAYSGLAMAFRHGIHRMSAESQNFLFLNSDCLFAENSLKNAASYLDKGYLAVESIGVRASGEQMMPHLQQYWQADHSLSIPSADLVKLAFDHELDRTSLHCWPGYLMFDVSETTKVMHSFAHNAFFLRFENGPMDFEGPNDRDFVYDVVPERERIKKLTSSNEFFYVDFCELGQRRKVRPGRYLSPLEYKKWQYSGWPRQVHIDNFKIPLVFKVGSLSPEEIAQAAQLTQPIVNKIVAEMERPSLRRQSLLELTLLKGYLTGGAKRLFGVQRF